MWTCETAFADVRCRTTFRRGGRFAEGPLYVSLKEEVWPGTESLLGKSAPSPHCLRNFVRKFSLA